MSAMSPDDPSSFSRPDRAVIKHMDLKLNVNFDKKVLNGSVLLQFEAKQPSDDVILDVSNISIQSVALDNGTPLDYKLDQHMPNYGSRLTVMLPTPVVAGKTRELLNKSYEKTQRKSPKSPDFLQKKFSYSHKPLTRSIGVEATPCKNCQCVEDFKNRKQLKYNESYEYICATCSKKPGLTDVPIIKENNLNEKVLDFINDKDFLGICDKTKETFTDDLDINNEDKNNFSEDVTTKPDTVDQAYNKFPFKDVSTGTDALLTLIQTIDEHELIGRSLEKDVNTTSYSKKNIFKSTDDVKQIRKQNVSIPTGGAIKTQVDKTNVREYIVSESIKDVDTPSNPEQILSRKTSDNKQIDETLDQGVSELPDFTPLNFEFTNDHDLIATSKRQYQDDSVFSEDKPVQVENTVEHRPNGEIPSPLNEKVEIISSEATPAPVEITNKQELMDSLDQDISTSENNKPLYIGNIDEIDVISTYENERPSHIENTNEIDSTGTSENYKPLHIENIDERVSIVSKVSDQDIRFSLDIKQETVEDTDKQEQIGNLPLKPDATTSSDATPAQVEKIYEHKSIDLILLDKQMDVGLSPEQLSYLETKERKSNVSETLNEERESWVHPDIDILNRKPSFRESVAIEIENIKEHLKTGREHLTKIIKVQSSNKLDETELTDKRESIENQSLKLDVGHGSNNIETIESINSDGQPITNVEKVTEGVLIVNKSLYQNPTTTSDNQQTQTNESELIDSKSNLNPEEYDRLEIRSSTSDVEHETSEEKYKKSQNFQVQNIYEITRNSNYKENYGASGSSSKVFQFNDPIAYKLSGELRKQIDKDRRFNIKIDYVTSPSASALQWLEPSQTSGKEHPYLFSQCQPIHARSIVPCQDSPAVKFTYSAEVTAPEQFTVLMSALKQKRTTNKTVFKQPVPIPSYLLALAVGVLEHKKIGPRSTVWSEKEYIEKSAWEFENTESYLQAAEKLCGPYVWGQYDLLVLPPSFPYGGMENPCLTFVTPTLLAGDRSQADVIIHEIMHSWTGNLVTNKNFEHFWLNEGFTVFLERKVAASLIENPEEARKSRDFHSLLGLQELSEAVNSELVNKSALTKLVVDLKHVHPDDAFSTVPYEKGSLFLRYLEDLTGIEVFDKFMRAYLKEFARQSLDTNQFKAFLLKYMAAEPAGHGSKLLQLDWDKWLYSPGMPPIIPKYDTSMTQAVTDLLERIANSSYLISYSDVANFTPHQMIHFLQELVEKPPLTAVRVEDLGEEYKINSNQNTEIRYRWLRLCVKSHNTHRVPEVFQFVNTQGRMKYVRPLYRDLYAWEEVRKEAIENFLKNEPNMMHVSAYTLRKDLHLTENLDKI